ncbi:hypothetical protein [Agromyces larvae]|uniref:Uncharacterized protein n=1 Tax=Agromyces larvae TaxID=2929802 RepID=A0ABY4BUL0_9MICO|nr:hypothetical protein [Agromyces larvae]UOE42892.1 hypothetical protein MTO99_11910 [Agromyces larvae]
MLILFIWTFPLNLLFLLWRRRTVSGHINVTVWAPGDRTFTEPVPVWTEVQRRDVFARVAELERLVAAGRGRAGR